ncbi:ankyrin repeat protein [Ilyonectria robusta]|uniref:ankyrin repeat protein n=1 Tax=Ilyonectria robusta TaxID=1079257 RepID=UPI001E8E74CD|nr:ankyrin repeat protein [Ilyonectria robusta]KAH8661760.1 ankyrin repeat protein [Ilyonectria robusta]
MDPLSIVASVIGIVGATTKTYETIDKITGLPKAFDQVQKDLPLVRKILERAQERLNNSEPTDDQRKAILAIAKPCDDKAKELKRIFDELETKCKEDQGAENWARVRVWYREALRGIKAHRVESLMEDILKGVEKLAWNEVFKLAMQEDLEGIKKAIEELSKVERSLEDSEIDTQGAIHASQTVAEGATAQMYNTQGGSHTFNSGKYITTNS